MYVSSRTPYDLLCVEDLPDQRVGNALEVADLRFQRIAGSNMSVQVDARKIDDLKFRYLVARV